MVGVERDLTLTRLQSDSRPCATRRRRWRIAFAQEK